MMVGWFDQFHLDFEVKCEQHLVFREVLGHVVAVLVTEARLGYTWLVKLNCPLLNHTCI